MEAFLEQGDVAPDTADRDGRTPLSLVAQFGYRGVVKMLLEREDVTPTLRVNTVGKLSTGQ